MKRLKKIFAILGIIILVALYLSTIVFALMDNKYSTKLLQASIFLTITFPVFLYAITFVYKLLNKK